MAYNSAKPGSIFFLKIPTNTTDQQINRTETPIYPSNFVCRSIIIKNVLSLTKTKLTLNIPEI